MISAVAVIVQLCNESSTPTYNELYLICSPIFQSLSVCELGIGKPYQISTFSIYKGINALYRPNNINYCLIVTQYQSLLSYTDPVHSFITS